MSFDDKAMQWDDDPQKIKRSQHIADGIINIIKDRSKLKALEFGAGTGALSFLLKDYCDSVTLVDSSDGMLDVLNSKIKTHGIKNFFPQNIDLLNDNTTDNWKFDIIYTAMTMHHIENLEFIISKFSTLLNNNGLLFIADLCAEDGNFHQGINEGVFHNGIDIDELSPVFEKYNLSRIDYRIVFQVSRNIDDKIIDYPVFLYCGMKK